jgi:hypothetical protein
MILSRDSARCGIEHTKAMAPLKSDEGIDSYNGGAEQAFLCTGGASPVLFELYRPSLKAAITAESGMLAAFCGGQ